MKNGFVKEVLPNVRDEFLREISVLHREVESLCEKTNDRINRLDKKINETAVDLVNIKFLIHDLQKTTVPQVFFNEELKKIMNSVELLVKKLEFFDKKIPELDNKFQEIAVVAKKIENSMVNKKNI